MNSLTVELCSQKMANGLEVTSPWQQPICSGTKFTSLVPFPLKKKKKKHLAERVNSSRGAGSLGHQTVPANKEDFQKTQKPVKIITGQNCDNLNIKKNINCSEFIKILEPLIIIMKHRKNSLVIFWAS